MTSAPRAGAALAGAVLTPDVIAPALVAWQREQGRRHLPWQATRDPYRVWLSEVMLQQTQVTTVLGYYERFLLRFPDVAALAAAPLDDVLTLWSGLGYYSRARNLHRCAQAVVERHGGRFPPSAALLAELPGIGRSTAAAIAAFCFGERVAILDGNVKRVLGRVLAFGDDLAGSAAERALWGMAQSLLPADPVDMPAYTQGLMDLGATLCLQRVPACSRCPLSGRCRGLALGNPLAYPVKSRKLKRSKREHWWLWLQAGEQIWLEQRPVTGVWSGLWTLPLYDDTASLQKALSAMPALGALQALPDVQHVLTHFDWLLHPRRLHLQAASACLTEPLGRPGRWVHRNELADVALPAPLRKLLLTTTPD